MRGLGKNCTRWRRHTSRHTDMATLWPTRPSGAELVKMTLLSLKTSMSSCDFPLFALLPSFTATKSIRYWRDKHRNPVMFSSPDIRPRHNNWKIRGGREGEATHQREGRGRSGHTIRTDHTDWPVTLTRIYPTDIWEGKSYSLALHMQKLHHCCQKKGLGGGGTFWQCPNKSCSVWVL